MDRKLVLYIAMSLDGYITDRHEGLGFLGTVEQEGEDYGYAAFNQTVDTVIMGRKTYDTVMAMGVDYPHADKTSYIITRRPGKGTEKLHFYGGSLKTLVNDIRKQPGKHIYCDGGAEIVNALLEEKLFDELVVSVIPVLLGGGIRLFSKEYPEQFLKLLNVQSFDKGLVQLHYRLVK
jgi:dihydrofolate reductase